MLSRRILRIKAMLALYAWHHSVQKNTARHEKEMLESIECIYDLYLLLLLLLVEIRECACRQIILKKSKRLPSPEDLNPNTRFADNRLLKILSANRHIAGEARKRKITWENDRDIVQKVFLKISKSDEYKRYLSFPEDSFSYDKKFILEICGKLIYEDEFIRFFLEEQNIHWVNDIDFVIPMLVKTIDSIPEQAGADLPLTHLYKNEMEDKKFVSDLFRTVVEITTEAEKMIKTKTQNWELERIAFMDVLLMKMAIAELLYFPTVPVKVTLNEYIELAKQYSTPKSNMFINGILDQLVADFRQTGKLKKAGRGLIEN